MIFKKKEKVMSFKEFLTLNKPVYKILQIIPDRSIRNYNSEEIASSICSLYKIPMARLKRNGFKITYNLPEKVSFFIDISITECKFYIICPSEYANLFKEKCNSVWNKSTIVEDNNFQFSWDDSKKYQVYYEKQDALSLKVDKKCNQPLNNILDVLEIMQGTDNVGIMYNFIPVNIRTWRELHKEMLDKFKAGKPMEKEWFNIFSILKYGGFAIQWILDNTLGLANDFLFNKDFGSTSKTFLEEVAISSLSTEQTKKISKLTREKGDEKVLKTQILVMSKSEDEKRKLNNAISVAESFQVLNENNTLTYQEFKTKKNTFHVSDFKIAGVKENTMSTKECQNLIEIPAYSLIQKHKAIGHVQTIQTQVPKELQSGYISLGNVKYKDNIQNSFLEDDYDIGSLPLTLTGSQGSGKSTFMANYYRFVNQRKQGGVIIDFIKNCEMADEVISYLPPEDVIILNYTKETDVQGFAFNELSMKEGLTTYQKLELANLQAQQVLTFVDSINIDQPLQSRMRKYLSAAANVVFSTGENSLKEVVKCLEEWDIRRKYLDMLNNEEKEYLEDEIKALNDLDEYSKVTKDNPVTEVIDTKTSKLEGILDRISLLREDFKLKYMFNKGSKGNINFAEELEKGKTIIIKMPQDSFKKHAKNVIVTFLLSKIWISTELRGKLNRKPKKTHIAIDEIFQTKTAMRMLANDEILPQCRKFGCKFIVSCQYTEQIEILMDTLIGAGSSFMLLRGTSEKDFKRFENKLKGYEYEDLRDMEKYHSLNLIYYSGGYASFISKLPKPSVINQKGE